MADLVTVLADVGAGASVIQVAQGTIHGIIHIRAYCDRAISLPNELRTIQCLPVLSPYLEKLQNQPATVDPSVLALLNDFKSTVDQLEVDVKRTLPLKEDRTK